MVQCVVYSSYGTAIQKLTNYFWESDVTR